MLAKELKKLLEHISEKDPFLLKESMTCGPLIWQIRKKYSEENDGHVYLLNVIDTFSKFALALPIKMKDGMTVSKSFQKIIISAESQNHKPPNLFHTDKGLEFENKHFECVLHNFGIKLYHTQNLE